MIKKFKFYEEHLMQDNDEFYHVDYVVYLIRANFLDDLKQYLESHQDLLHVSDIENGFSFLHYAIHYKRWDMAQYLINEGVYLNANNQLLKKPIDYITYENHEKELTYLDEPFIRYLHLNYTPETGIEYKENVIEVLKNTEEKIHLTSIIKPIELVKKQIKL